jgi:hypothetical protein
MGRQGRIKIETEITVSLIPVTILTGFLGQRLWQRVEIW